MINYKNKYLKYKNKYLKLSKLVGSAKVSVAVADEEKYEAEYEYEVVNKAAVIEDEEAASVIENEEAAAAAVDEVAVYKKQKEEELNNLLNSSEIKQIGEPTQIRQKVVILEKVMLEYAAKHEFRIATVIRNYITLITTPDSEIQQLVTQKYKKLLLDKIKTKLVDLVPIIYAGPETVESSIAKFGFELEFSNISFGIGNNTKINFDDNQCKKFADGFTTKTGIIPLPDSEKMEAFVTCDLLPLLPEDENFKCSTHKFGTTELTPKSNTKNSVEIITKPYDTQYFRGLFISNIDDFMKNICMFLVYKCLSWLLLNKFVPIGRKCITTETEPTKFYPSLQVIEGKTKFYLTFHEKKIDSNNSLKILKWFVNSLSTDDFVPQITFEISPNKFFDFFISIAKVIRSWQGDLLTNLANFLKFTYFIPNNEERKDVFVILFYILYGNSGAFSMNSKSYIKSYFSLWFKRYYFSKTYTYDEILGYLIIFLKYYYDNFLVKCMYLTARKTTRIDNNPKNKVSPIFYIFQSIIAQEDMLKWLNVMDTNETNATINIKEILKTNAPWIEQLVTDFNKFTQNPQLLTTVGDIIDIKTLKAGDKNLPPLIEFRGFTNIVFSKYRISIIKTLFE